MNNGITDLWSVLDEVTIKYVAVELKTKNAPEEKLIGALVGIGPISGLTDFANHESVFIWIATGEKFECFKILNSEDYEITLIHIGAIFKGGLTQNSQPEGCIQISSGSSSDANLERCRLVLDSIGKTQKHLLDGDSGLVDAARFTDWTFAIKKRISGDKVEKSGANVIEKKPDLPFYQGNSKNDCGYLGYTTKKVTTGSFKRSTKYPIKIALDTMKKKLCGIKEKTYTPTNPFVADDKVEAKPESSSESSLTDYLRIGYYVRIITGPWEGWEGQVMGISNHKLTIKSTKGTHIEVAGESCVVISEDLTEESEQIQWQNDGCFG